MGEEGEEAGAVGGVGVDVPFFVGPDFVGPPVAAGAPGAEGAGYGVVLGGEGGGLDVEMVGAAFGLGDFYGGCGAEAAEGYAGALILGWVRKRFQGRGGEL